nr:ribonuclease H-like domain-containing protein [Tanacetum cinerariifolium]
MKVQEVLRLSEERKVPQHPQWMESNLVNTRWLDRWNRRWCDGSHQPLLVYLQNLLLLNSLGVVITKIIILRVIIVRIKGLHEVTTAQVIVNGDSVTAVTSGSTEGLIPPKTAKQKLARKNKLKAKSTLMLVIPDEHLLKFHACKDANLPSAWNNIALIMGNKSDLDTLSMDDLYNNLKVYEFEIKGQSSSSSNSQNVAFVSFDNTSSTNETANTTHNVSAASSKDQASTASYNDDDVIDRSQMEVAMLTMRVKRRDHFAREYRAPRIQGNRNRDAPIRNAPVDTSTTNALVVQDGIDRTGLGYDGHVNKHEVLNNVVDRCECDGDDNQVNDRFKKSEGYHIVSSPYTRNYMPPKADLSFAGLDYYVFKSKLSETITSVSKIEINASKTSKDSLEKPKTIRSSASIIKD